MTQCVWKSSPGASGDAATVLTTAPAGRGDHAGRDDGLGSGQAARLGIAAGWVCGALRRSKLVAIGCEHLRFTPQGTTMLIPRLKHDPMGEGERVGIPHGMKPLSCPVRVVEA